MMTSRELDTICAVSTPHGIGGLSVIRVSGPNSVRIGRAILGFLPKVLESHRVYFGRLKSHSGVEIDEVLVAYFEKGRSFTGDETLEISCHGNPQICERILAELVIGGARAADRGEFTYRAFLNGKVDLIQAEAVLSVIEAQSASASRLALRQLKGELSNSIAKIEDVLTWCLAHIEAGIDFSTEGIDVIDKTTLLKKMLESKEVLTALLNSYSHGKLVKDGIKIVFAGRPNVGKSSLLNLVLMKERAIVSDIAGTTRDVIDGEILYLGFRFHFFDTAGLRDISDQIEFIGIQKSYEEQEDADLILLVLDSGDGFTEEDSKILRGMNKAKVLVVLNKSDLMERKSEKGNISENLHELGFLNKVSLSALEKGARELLLNKTLEVLNLKEQSSEVLLSNSRHHENLLIASSRVSDCVANLSAGIDPEFLALDLKEALVRIQETLGKRFDDQVMDRVFKEFCIGK